MKEVIAEVVTGERERMVFEIIANIVGAICLFAAAVMIVRSFIVSALKERDESVPQLIINEEREGDDEPTQTPGE